MKFFIDGIATVPIAAQPILTTHPIRPTQNSSIREGWPLKGLQIESSVIPFSEKVQLKTYLIRMETKIVYETANLCFRS